MPVFEPIGVVRSPFVDKVDAPRQAVTAEGIEGRIEILPEHEHALDDLDGFERIWVLFWFHRATPGTGKVLPPRSDKKRGVFATRSPHRPNPIGMSAVRLVKVEGLVVHVRDIDMIDGTPVLDVKPYVPYADAFPDAKDGWVGADPIAPWSVAFAVDAEAQLAWIGGDLRARVAEALALGPQPHPYRRIKKTDGGLVLAAKEWRARFRVDQRVITVERIASGYRERDLAAGTEPVHALHRAFVARFG